MSDTSTLRDQLVATLRQRGVLTDERVATAFRAVPREVFIPGAPLETVYRDEAIVTKETDGVPVSSSSQPAIMAIMLEQLDARPGMRVLEIGAGTGYNAALLARLVEPAGRVVTVDIDPEVAGWARERLTAAGFAGVEVIHADGADGWPPAAPYDRVELTVGVADLSPAWVEQLTPGGRLVVPLWINTAQLCVALEREDGRLTSRSTCYCGFMRIRGKLAGSDRYIPLRPGVLLATGDPDPPLDLLRDLLSQTPRRAAWDGSRFDGFTTYAALWGGQAIGVTAEDEAATGFKGAGFGLLDASADAPSLALIVSGEPASELLIYGGEPATERLRALREQWQRAGSPRAEDLRLDVYPRDQAPPAPANAVAIDTAHWRVIVSTQSRPA